jgi:hypothetical protein
VLTIAELINLSKPYFERRDLNKICREYEKRYVKPKVNKKYIEYPNNT